MRYETSAEGRFSVSYLIPHTSYILPKRASGAVFRALPRSSSVNLRPHPEFAHEKCEPVGRFFDHLARGLARAVAGLGLDADERRRRPRLALLQTRRELEAVRGH